jgi:hypothetical protein
MKQKASVLGKQDALSRWRGWRGKELTTQMVQSQIIGFHIQFKLHILNLHR